MSLGSENEFQEFKVELAELDVGLKSLSTMLNRHGHGSVYFGVNNDGTIRGLEIGSNTLVEIRNKLTLKIKPRFFNTIEVCDEGSKTYIKVTGRGEDRPYSFDGRYYLRNANSDEQATNEMLRRMLISGTTDLIQQMPSAFQSLSFKQLFATLRDQGLHVTDTENCRRSLNLFNANDQLNFMAYLLSDENNLPIKVVRFAGNNKEVMLERTVYQNQCLLQSVQDVLNYVRALNTTMVDLSEGQRKELSLFSYDAFREAWINATLHCSWAERIPPSVFIFDDRIEVISYGSIPYGLSLDGFYKGISRPVNKALMMVFNAARLSEQTGHGNPTIIAHCGRDAFSFEDGTVIVRIPFTFVPRQALLRQQQRRTTATQDRILQYLSVHPTATLQHVADAIQMSESNVKKVTAKLQTEGLLRREGSRRASRWCVPWQTNDSGISSKA